jgi:hypothetical protein
VSMNLDYARTSDLSVRSCVVTASTTARAAHSVPAATTRMRFSHSPRQHLNARPSAWILLIPPSYSAIAAPWLPLVPARALEEERCLRAQRVLVVLSQDRRVRGPSDLATFQTFVIEELTQRRMRTRYPRLWPSTRSRIQAGRHRQRVEASYEQVSTADRGFHCLQE